MLTATDKKQELRKPLGQRVPLTAIPLVAVVVLVGAVMLWYASRHIEHQVYAMGYSVGQSQAAVETWSLHLPGRYEVVYWVSNPKSQQDGLRLFRRDQE